MPSRSGFTLIELLVVLAVISILSVVVILTLNPVEIFRQSRDSNRLSDLATLNEALGVYSEDVGTSLGAPSTVYISIPDPSATSTAGDQCQGLVLPSLPGGYTYHCAPSSNYRNVDGTGWIPVNFTSISSGNPVGTLPVDSINQTSGGLYYTYVTNGTVFQITSHLESQKYLPSEVQSGGPDIASYKIGSNPSLAPVAGGLVGYWNFDEGTGSTANDLSGLANNGSWSGTQAGSSGYYSAGKIGSYAGFFNGTNDLVTAPASNLGISDITMMAWVKPTSLSGFQRVISSTSTVTNPYSMLFNGTNLTYQINNSGHTNLSSATISNGVWTHIAVTFSSSTRIASLYVNGAFDKSYGGNGVPANATETTFIGGGTGAIQLFKGLIDDVRIYNRVLSSAEIQAIYNAQQ